MGIVRLNWKIKLNYLLASIKAVFPNPSLDWWSMLAPFSNNIWTTSLCPYLAAKNRKKNQIIYKTQKKESEVFKINVFNEEYISVFWSLYVYFFHFF